MLIANIWKCQSLAKDVCKEQMPRCKFQSESLRCLRLSKWLSVLPKKVFTERMHSAVGVYLRTEDWIEDDPHPNLRCQLIDVCGNCSICVMCACTTVRLYLTSFSSVQTQGAVVPFSSLPTWYSQADPGLGPHTTCAIPKNARRRPSTAELLEGWKRNAVRTIRRR